MTESARPAEEQKDRSAAEGAAEQGQMETPERKDESQEKGASDVQAYGEPEIPGKG